MGKTSRRKAHRQDARNLLPRGARPLNTIEDIEAAEELWTPDTPGRVTYLDDPVLGAGQPAAGISPDGQLVPDDSGTTEPIPVVMFEPAQVVMMRNTVTGLVQETKTEASSPRDSTGAAAWSESSSPRRAPCRRRRRRSRWSARSEARTNDLQVRPDDGHTRPRGRPGARDRW